MDLIVLKKKISSYRTPKGRITSLPDELLGEILHAWEQCGFRSRKPPITIIAYLSSALPLIYLSAPYGLETKTVKLVADLLTIVGFLIMTWATIDLGTKLGVSPAKRGTKCTKGLYRFTSHPMYLGYVVAHFGWLFIDFRNIFIHIASLLSFYLRAKAENKIIRD